MTNRLGDMLREMRDPNLPAQREAEIVRLMNEESERMDIYRSWLGVNKLPDFRYIHALDGIFDRIPLGAAESACSNSFNQTILNNTAAVVAFDTKTPVYNDTYFYVDPTNHTVVVRKVPLRIAVIGYYGMTSGATNYMRMNIQRYDKTDTLQQWLTLDRSQLANASGYTMAQFIRVYNTVSHGIQPDDYFNFEWYQNSGATMTSDTFQATFFAIT